MTNKLYDSKGQLIGYIRTVEKNLHDDLTRVILSTGHELVFGPCDLTSDRDGNWRIRSGALYPRCEGKKTASATNTAAIKDVIFAPPATIVYWSDGSKTVVKCSKKDVFDPEKGLAMAIAKRCGGNKGRLLQGDPELGREEWEEVSREACCRKNCRFGCAEKVQF